MVEHSHDKDHLLPTNITPSEMGVAIALASVTSIGNLLVIIAVYKDPFGDLRTISNWLVVNLSAADLVVGLIVEPIWAIQYWVKKDQNYSIAANMMLILSVDASCFTVLFLTIERYIVLEMPLRHETVFSIAATRTYIFLIWLTASVISSIVIPCWNPAERRIYHLFIFTGLGCFLLFVMLCLYIRMFIIIRNFNQALIKQGTRQQLLQPAETSIQAHKREQEVAKSIFLFVGTMALCWLPSVIAETIRSSDGSVHVSEHMCRATIFLGLLNSALNPIIYTFRMYSFRRAIVRVFVSRASAGVAGNCV